jgi:hypothetical protein
VGSVFRNLEAVLMPEAKSNDDINPCLTAAMPIYNEASIWPEISPTPLVEWANQKHAKIIINIPIVKRVSWEGRKLVSASL